MLPSQKLFCLYFHLLNCCSPGSLRFLLWGLMLSLLLKGRQTCQLGEIRLSFLCIPLLPHQSNSCFQDILIPPRKRRKKSSPHFPPFCFYPESFTLMSDFFSLFFFLTPVILKVHWNFSPCTLCPRTSQSISCLSAAVTRANPHQY